MAIGVMAMGALALAGVAYLQMDRYALTRFATMGNRAAAGVEAWQFVAAARQSSGDEPFVENVTLPATTVAVVNLPPIKIEATRSHLSTAVDPVVPVQLVPCAHWRDLGPLSVSADDSKPAEQRRVQMLCTPGTWPPLLEPSS
jgi:hypothetical protein